jgi:hypothetical protein
VSKFYQYDTRGASPADQIINLERMVAERDEELDKTRHSNWDICVAVREYNEALTAVHTFVNAYLQNGGDPTTMPERWADLDHQRQLKYATLLQVGGLTQ